MNKLGFNVVDALPCEHKGNWGWAKLVGFGMRTCGDCGHSWVLVVLDDGNLAWEPVLEPEQTKDLTKTIVVEGEDDSAAHLGEGVQPVPDTEGNVRLLSQPEATGRAGQSLQDVPDEVERDATTEGSEEALQ